MGIEGNCVCFRQDIADICNILPRTRVNAIKIIRTYNDRSTTGVQNYNVFVIRKNVVIRALHWLKQYHRWYRDDPDLKIQESNLDWMGNNDEAQLLDITAETSNLIECKQFDSVMHEQDIRDQTSKQLHHQNRTLTNNMKSIFLILHYFFSTKI